MKLQTTDIEARLQANGRQQKPLRGTDDEIDFHPIVKAITRSICSTHVI